MSTSETPRRHGPRDAHVVKQSPATRPEILGSAVSSTETLGRAVRRLTVLPLMGAAFAVPSWETGCSRLFSVGQRSRSEIVVSDWYVDDWVYTEERGTMEQVRALNALLALPAREGFSLDLPD